MEQHIYNKTWLINFYREQLKKFEELGLGKNTEFRVRVTPELIAITKKRLMQICGLKAINLKYFLSRQDTVDTMRKRRKKLNEDSITLEKLLNETKPSTNGAIKLKKRKVGRPRKNDGDRS